MGNSSPVNYDGLYFLPSLKRASIYNLIGWVTSVHKSRPYVKCKNSKSDGWIYSFRKHLHAFALSEIRANMCYVNAWGCTTRSPVLLISHPFMCLEWLNRSSQNWASWSSKSRDLWVIWAVLERTPQTIHTDFSRVNPLTKYARSNQKAHLLQLCFPAKMNFLPTDANTLEVSALTLSGSIGFYSKYSLLLLKETGK